MTASDTTPARANRNGHLCPPWCVTDHRAVMYTDQETGEPFYRSVHSSGYAGGDHRLRVRLVAHGYCDAPDRGPLVSVVLQGGGHVPFAGDPGKLAELVEMLADVGFQEMVQLGVTLRAADKAARGEA